MFEGFKPMKWPNDPVRLEDIKGEYMMSQKMDGYRCVFVDGKMLGSKLKPVANAKMQKKFQHIKDLSRDTGSVIDGELYEYGGDFNVNGGIIRSDNHDVPEELKFYAFDILPKDHRNMPAKQRNVILQVLHGTEHLVVVPQYIVHTTEEILDHYGMFRDLGYEGAILKHVNSQYKFGRITPKSGMGYKLKPFQTWDVRITGVVQATKCKDGEEYRTINELGKSKTSHKQEDRVLIEKAGAFTFTFNGYESSATLCMTDVEKMAVWKNRNYYIGKMMEVSGMMVGAKDRIRHPRCIRLREDL